MKTLIINGSPRKHGDTTALIDALTQRLDGEIRTVSCRDDISPCIDCRFCWTHDGCALQDDMQALYRYLPGCDNVVLASPIWFSSLSGPTLNICSRLQTYFAAMCFRNEAVVLKPKKGLLLLAGGQHGTERAPIQTTSVIMRLIGVASDRLSVVSSMDTDRLPAAADRAAMDAIAREALRLNQPL